MRQRLSISYLAIILAILTLFLLMPLVANSKGAASGRLVLPRQTEEAYLIKIAPDVEELAKAYGIKPSVLMGQLALTSNYGRNFLAVKYQNPLALLAEPNQDAVSLRAPIYVDKAWTESRQTFAVYTNWQDSLADYLNRLKQGKTWSSDLYKKMATAKTYKEVIKALEEANFSPDLDYFKHLNAIIEKHKLSQYDK